MIVDIVVDAVAPRASPAVAAEQLFKHRRRVEGLRQPKRVLVDDEWPSRMIRNDRRHP